jgi:hypothetical protein
MIMGWHMVMEFEPSLIGCYIWDANHSFRIIFASPWGSERAACCAAHPGQNGTGRVTPSPEDWFCDLVRSGTILPQPDRGRTRSSRRAGGAPLEAVQAVAET